MLYYNYNYILCYYYIIYIYASAIVTDIFECEQQAILHSNSQILSRLFCMWPPRLQAISHVFVSKLLYMNFLDCEQSIL